KPAEHLPHPLDTTTVPPRERWWFLYALGLLGVSSSSYVHPWWRLSTFLLAVVIAVGGPLIILTGDGGNAGEVTGQQVEKTAVSAGSDITGNSSYSDFVENSTGSQVTYVQLDGDFR